MMTRDDERRPIFSSEYRQSQNTFTDRVMVFFKWIKNFFCCLFCLVSCCPFKWETDIEAASLRLDKIQKNDYDPLCEENQIGFEDGEPVYHYVPPAITQSTDNI